MHKRIGIVTAVALSTLLVAAIGLAGLEDVYVGNSSNGHIMVIDAATGQSQRVNADNLSDLQGLLVTDDGLDGVNLVVCETQASRIWRYSASPVGEATGQLITEDTIAHPDGVSAAPGGDLYVVNSGSGASAGSNAELWRIASCPSCASGYSSEPEAIDLDVPAELLEDTVVVGFQPPSGSLELGDVLVLSRDPAKVWRYREQADGSWSREVFIDEGAGGLPAGCAPTGAAFAPDGRLLVVTLGGSILRFDTGGARVEPDFANDLGNGKFRIAVGRQADLDRAFVSSRNGGELLRFDILADGTGSLLDSVSDGLQFPVGVGTATSGAAPTLPGSNVRTAPASANRVTFEQVDTTGLTSSRVFLFADPNPGGVRFLSDVEGLLSETGLEDREIPSYINAFMRDGVPTLALFVLDTTAVFAATYETQMLEDRLGFTTSCDDPEGEQPRAYHATDADDQAIVEGEVFHDISAGCGTSFGRGFDMSGILLGWDSRSVSEVGSEKLNSLLSAITGADPEFGGLADYIDDQIERKLERDVNNALRAHERGDTDRALRWLDSYLDTVASNPQAFDDSSRNVSGELDARGESARYIVCGAIAPDCNRLLP